MPDRITDGFFALDAGGTLTYANRQASLLLFDGRNDLIGRNLWSEFPNAICESIHRHCEKAVRDQEAVLFEEFDPNRSLWFEFKAYPSEDGSSVYFRDFTEMKKADNDAELIYSALLDQHPAGVFSIRDNLELIRVNPSAEKMTGYTAKELRQINLVSLVPPEDIPETCKYYRMALNGEAQHFESHLICRDGKILTTDVILLSNAANGRSKGVYSIVRDITEQKHMRRLLEESEQKHKTLAENALDIITYSNTKGIFQYVSPAIRNLLGYDEKEVIGTDMWAYLHPDELSAVKTIMPLNDIHSEAGTFVCRFRHKNGVYVWFETNFKWLRDRKGDLYRCIKVWRDITDRKNAEVRLLHAQRIGQFGSWERSMDNESSYWSEEMYRIYGLEPGCDTSSEALVKYVHPDDRDKLNAAYRTIESDGSFSAEYRIVRPDGELRYVFTRGELLYKRGKVSMIFGLLHDITERKKAEEELKRSKDNLKLAQQIAGLGHYDWDVVRNQLYWSDELARIWGLPPCTHQETIQALYDTVHPEDLALVKHVLHSALHGGPLEMEYRILHSDGSIHIIHAVGQTIFDETGSAIRLFGTARDITNQKNTEELLRKSEKLSVAGQLAAGIAHEIRNPLTSIKGFMKLMRPSFQARGENSKEGQYFDIISSELNRIETILTEMLLLAKPQATDYHEQNVLDILNDVVTLSETQAILRNVQIIEDFERNIPKIRCDGNQLKQVFINFVKNGIEAITGGGSIFIEVKKYGSEHVSIRFIDEGCGIPKELLSKLGEPFYTTKDKGTGLGLMVSFKIIQQHDGEIDIASEMGQGTTVSILLPVKGPANL